MQRLTAGSIRMMVLVVAASSNLLFSCSGEGSGDETITVRLASDQDCYGTAIDVDESGLSAADRGTLASCTPDAELVALGCEAHTAITDTHYELSTNGCFTPDGTALFQCTVTKALADRFRQNSELRCGCGCAENCPMEPAVIVCDDRECTAPGEGAASAAPAESSYQQGSSRTTRNSFSSSTINCGTECDVEHDVAILLTSGSSIREIEFDLAFVDNSGCHCNGSCDLDSRLAGPTNYSLEHVCVADPQGLAATTTLLGCEYDGGGFQVTNVRALGGDLRPLSPAPVVTIDY